MTVTLVSRWSTNNVPAATEASKRAKAMWVKHGALDFRLNLIFTGPYTGQFMIAQVFADMAAVSKAWDAANADPQLQQILADNAKVGSVMHEREILISVDL
jgi:hypothetical protein